MNLTSIFGNQGSPDAYEVFGTKYKRYIVATFNINWLQIWYVLPSHYYNSFQFNLVPTESHTNFCVVLYILAIKEYVVPYARLKWIPSNLDKLSSFKCSYQLISNSQTNTVSLLSTGYNFIRVRKTSANCRTPPALLQYIAKLNKLHRVEDLTKAGVTTKT